MDDTSRDQRIRAGGITIGFFHALLATPSLKAVDQYLAPARELLGVHEFALAFEYLTAVIVNHNCDMSADALAILNELGGRMKLREKDWHGLKSL